MAKVIKKAKDIKNTKDSTTKIKEEKVAAYKGFEYFDADSFNFDTWTEKPTSKAYIEDMARRLVQWSRSDDALKMAQFYALEGVHGRTVERWAQKHPFLREAMDVAIQALGVRREIGGLTRKFDPAIVVRSMPIYDEKWTQETERLVKIKAKLEEKNPTNVSVYMDGIPLTNVVPNKPEESE